MKTQMIKFPNKRKNEDNGPKYRHQFTYAELEHHHNGKNYLDGVAAEIVERLFEEDEQQDDYQRHTHLPHEYDLSRIGLTYLNSPARDMLHGSGPANDSVGD
ncbi:hypothetical protein C1H46_005884 [Malus baccata]|uniref:Uncharacterized protein n=1 Tax=Malus baccata TaxID=106549 RepID=A0A540NC16_MALBA|nr:hypothetical protein C1H46_005884 [Malus baccata]